MRKFLLATLLLLGAVAAVVAGPAAFAGDDDGDSFKAQLNGYNEVVGGPAPGSTGSVSTGATGTFKAKVKNDPKRLEFTLTYKGIEGGTVTQAHPHFAQRHVGGDIFAFFCGGPKPACPTPGGTVAGTLLASDILGPSGQGVAPGDFDEFVHALRAGAVYVNVHSSPLFPEGEIRGQINDRRGDRRGKKKDDD